MKIEIDISLLIGEVKIYRNIESEIKNLVKKAGKKWTNEVAEEYEKLESKNRTQQLIISCMVSNMLPKEINNEG